MLHLSKSRIESTFAANEQTVFSRSEINRLINLNLEAWTVDEPSDIDHVLVVESKNQTDVLKTLLDQTDLKEVRLGFPYRSLHRYTWREPPTFRVIQSVDPKGYFSHYTAMQMHDLTEQIPKTVYFNVEQPATGGGGSLSQEGINRAFAGKCRVSRNVIKFRDVTVYKLNGQNTGELGVIRSTVDDSYEIRLTDIERTLIDATVRPIYAGGVAQVARAFKAASGRVSIKRIVGYLRKLNHTYPYHQAVGFYLETAGNYDEIDVARLRALPIEFDFYLNYQLKNPAYNETWRLYVPKGL